MSDKQVGDRLKEIRQIYGDTQASLAKKIGVSNGFLNSWETGAYIFNAQFDKIINIKKAYPEINISWLLFGEGEMFKLTETNQSGPEEPMGVYKSADQYSKNISHETYKSAMQYQEHLEEEITWLRRIIEEYLKVTIDNSDSIVENKK